jgi:hypothetical protein
MNLQAVFGLAWMHLGGISVSDLLPRSEIARADIVAARGATPAGLRKMVILPASVHA